jgi:hypothetical protein
MLHTIESVGLPPADYVPPVAGNGDVMMMLDETGAQCRELPEPYRGRIGPKPRIWMPGRRMDGPLYPLFPFGYLEAEVHTKGFVLQREMRCFWRQTLDARRGMVFTEERYPDCRVETATFVLLDRNVIVLMKRVQGSDATVTVRHVWGRQDDPLQFPRRVRPSYGEMRGGCPGIRADYVLDGIREFHGCLALFTLTPGARAEHSGNSSSLHVPARDGEMVCAILMLQDDLDEDWQERAEELPHWSCSLGAQGLVEHQERLWQEVCGRAFIELPASASRVQDVWETCRMMLAGAATRWSVPPGYSASQWDMRLFHDELFPQRAMFSMNLPDRARRVADFRRATLDVARARTGGRGARYAWESIEDGRDGLPLCHTVFYEIWHMASIAAVAWQDWRHTGCVQRLRDVCYPVIRDCAEFFRHWALVEDSSGAVTTVPCVDLDESRLPVRGALGTMAGALASVRWALAASRILGVDAELQAEWARLEERLARCLPVRDGRFVPSPGAEHEALAAVQPVFPFEVVHPSDPVAVASVLSYHDRCRTKFNWGPTSDANSSWTWNTAWMVIALARMGDGERAGAAIEKATHSAHTFGGVNECMGDDGVGSSVWFNTTAGAFVQAVSEMLLGSWDDHIRLFPAIPADWCDVRFRLLAAGPALVEAELAAGRLRRVTILREAAGAQQRDILIPERMVGETPRVTGGRFVGMDRRDGIVRLTLESGGETVLDW